MAKAAKEIAPKPDALANWDAELAAAAKVSAGMEANTGGIPFFSVRGGILAFDGQAVKENQIATVIADTILVNAYYTGKYDPENPQSPRCFAIGRDEATLAPHPTVVAAGQAENVDCRTCPRNQFGSADVGKGKACKNGRRLALLSAGTFDKEGKFQLIDDVDHVKTTALACLNVSPTSIKGYSTFVKQVAGALQRPPHGVITKVKVVPDAKTQFKITFDPICKVPNQLMGAVMERHKEAGALIEFPFPLGGDDAPVAAKTKDAPAGRKPPAKKKY